MSLHLVAPPVSRRCTIVPVHNDRSTAVQAGAELTETERRATEIQATFEREQRRQQQQQQAGGAPVPGGTAPDGGPSLQRPGSSVGGQPSPEAYGSGGGRGGNNVPGASATREGDLRRQSLPGQGQQQQLQSRSSSRNSSATAGPPLGVGGDPRRRTIRELVAATQVQHSHRHADAT